MDSTPFRWDLVSPDQLGSLVDTSEPFPTSFLDELVEATGKVLARSGGGDLVFVGRSLDSMFDLLGGVLDGTGHGVRLHRLPLSFARDRTQAVTPEHERYLRQQLTQIGLSPGPLARRAVPAVLVDVAHTGGTFGELFEVLRAWVAETREPWAVVRTKLRFLGVTSRTHTSPNTWRWQQHADWTSELPTSAVKNVSLDRFAWSYFADQQDKLTRSHRIRDWVSESEGPARDERTRRALAEALAYVAAGRSAETRSAVVRAMRGEPAMSEPWLRSLVVELGR